MTILKYTALLFLTAFTGCTVFGQPAVKTYAFKQDVLPGTVPAGVTDENGNGLNTSRVGHFTNFYIYLTHDNQSEITPVGLWINGIAYKFRSELIKNTPVSIVNPNMPEHPTTTILVPNTRQKVTRLLVLESGDTTSILTESQKKRINASPVVVSYNWKSRIYYTTAAELKKLEPVAHQ